MNTKEKTFKEYAYNDYKSTHTHEYLWKDVITVLAEKREIAAGVKKRVFELGCGNGAFARRLNSLDFKVSGTDPSAYKIALANQSVPLLNLAVGSVYDELDKLYGRFPFVVSLGVVEHVYYPREYAKCVADLLEPGGCAVISAPYHGYLKNLMLALSGKMDTHFTALRDHGHIKFWSIKTLTQLFFEESLLVEKVLRVGRISVLAKSMILVLRKPDEDA